MSVMSLANIANHPAETRLRLFNAKQSSMLDQALIYAGIAPYELMRRAGQAAFFQLLKKWPDIHHLGVICGAGNNAGDGYVVASLACKQGWQVTIIALKSIDKLSAEARQAAQAALNGGAKLLPVSQLAQLASCQLIVDALLGTGFKGQLHADYAHVIRWVNQNPQPCLALDIPSGIDADSGRADLAIQADLTVSFISAKFGLYTGAAADYLGYLVIDDLGIDQQIAAQLPAQGQLLARRDLNNYLPPRLPTTHKGQTGRLLVVGGDLGFGGTGIMVSTAAARVGAGRISLATRAEYAAAALTYQPELMVKTIDEIETFIPLLEKCDCLVIGAGLGQQKWGKSLWAIVNNVALPQVVDADGLHWLAKMPNRNEQRILTPHPGEAAVLLNTSIKEIQQNRLEAAKALWQRYGGVIVLKGKGTLIVNGLSETNVLVCPYGNPGMASGGMGDILGGVIAGLLTQGLPIFAAASSGVLVHALAADQAAQCFGQRGLLATDLLPFIHQLVNPWVKQNIYE